MSLIIVSISDFFNRIQTFDINYCIYIPNDTLKLGDKILIHDPDDIDDYDYDEPLPAREMGLKEGISVIDCLGIINNLKNQGVSVDAEIFLKGLNYYLQNDAFIEYIK